MDIYVGNLAYATTDEGLKAAFAAYGEVTSARVVTDRTSGRSKGFGFVEMPNREQAQAAIGQAMSKDPANRFLRCSDFVDALEGKNGEEQRFLLDGRVSLQKAVIGSHLSTL